MKINDRQPEQRTGPRDVGTVLKSPILSSLLTQLRQHEEFTNKFKGYLPPELAHQLISATLQDDRLILSVTSAAWAARVRFIAFSLREKFPNVTEVHIKVLPQTQNKHEIQIESKPVKKPVRKLPPEVAEQLRTLASNTPDPKLKATLLRLASRGDLENAPPAGVDCE